MPVFAPHLAAADPPAPAWLSSQEAPQDAFRVLSLSGGGFLGLFTASVLAGLESRGGEPLGRQFGLVAGTSVGAILAAAVATQTPMQQMVQLFREHGAEVFSGRPLPEGGLARLLDMSRSVWAPKYDGKVLRERLQAQWGDLRLGDLRHRLLIPAVDIGRSQTKVFKTPHTPASRGDEGLRLVDVVMASCAAPAYFPGVRVGDRLYADGGLFAVAPDQVALHEVEHFLRLPPQHVFLLSLGTALQRYRSLRPSQSRAGAVQWLAQGRLVLTLMAAQQQHVQAMMEDRLGTRYLRLDADWPAQAGLGLDVATAQATQVLTTLAEATLRRMDQKGWPAWLMPSPGTGAAHAAGHWDGPQAGRAG